MQYNRMIEMYDIVRSLVDLNDKIPLGNKGAVLILYPDAPLHYEFNLWMIHSKH